MRSSIVFLALIACLCFVANAAPADDGSCSMCEYVVGFAESWVENNATEAQIQQYLDGLCDLTPDPTDCQSFVNSNLPTIIAWLEQNETPQTICTQLGMCSSKKTNALKVKAKQQVPKDDGSCTLCKYVVGIAEDWVENNATEAQIQQYLDGICDLTPDPTDCTAFVNANLPAIISWLEQNESPDTICQQLGLCTSTKKTLNKNNSIKMKHLTKITDGTCSMCQYIAAFVTEWVENNATEAEIQQYLDGLCDFTPDPSDCQAFVNANLPTIIAWVEQNETPDAICQQLGFCTSKAPKKTQKISAHAGNPSDDGTCSLCLYITGIVESWIENNATEAQIEQYLDGICNFTPDPTDCAAFVNANLPTIISWLEQNETPQQICTQLGLCTSKKVVAKPAVKQTTCDVCEGLVSTVEGWLNSQNTEQEIVAKLTALCNFIPQLAQTCDAIIQAGIPAFIQWVEDNENSTVVCAQLGLCAAKAPVKNVHINVAPKVQDVECDTCQQVVQAIEYWLSQNATEIQIEQFFETYGCQSIPAWETTCDAIVEKGWPQVIAWINANEGPAVVCQQLGLCTSNKVKPVKGLKAKFN